LVGLDHQLYIVHREIICSKSPFFEKCLNSGLFESTTSEVELPVDLPAAFEEVLKWVYSGNVTSPFALPASEGETIVQNLVHTYILADKLCMESLCNQIVDTVKAWHEEFHLMPTILVPFRGGVLSDSGLRTFLIRQLALDICAHEPADDLLAEFFEQGGSEVWEVVKRMRELQREFTRDNVCNADPSREDPNCVYHRHRDTKSCLEPAKEKVTSTKQKRIVVKGKS
jgi:BTB/POZ domain